MVGAGQTLGMCFLGGKWERSGLGQASENRYSGRYLESMKRRFPARKSHRGTHNSRRESVLSRRKLTSAAHQLGKTNLPQGTASASAVLLVPAEMFSPGDCMNYAPQYYVRKCLQIMLSYPSCSVMLFQSVLHAIHRNNFCQLKTIKQNKTKMK